MAASSDLLLQGNNKSLLADEDLIARAVPEAVRA
jgi:hypothetical protein